MTGTCLFVCVLGPGFDSTSPAFVRSRASHAAGSDGRLAQKRNRAPPISEGRVVLIRFVLVQAVSFWNIDDESSVASFTSANDDNQTYLHSIDNRYLHIYVLYVSLVIDIDRLMDSDLLYHWVCFIELALHYRCLFIGSVASKMGIQMNVQVYNICKHYSNVLYI